MDDRTALAWLARRVGFGLAPGQLDAMAQAGLSTTLDRWLAPDAHGVAAAPDPWAALDPPNYRPRGSDFGIMERTLISDWLRAMAATPRPGQEWVRWYWHGHFVSTMVVVGRGDLMTGQLRLFAAEGLGDFPTLLRAVTVDPAMLIYLNGNTSAVGRVNENYGREVLELFALGIGNYTEDDVRAGATALTGWTITPGPQAQFRPARHDDTPQTYLGTSGVHDVDTVVDAIVHHPSCGPFIAGGLARAVLGPGVSSSLVSSLTKDFVSSGLQLGPLLRAIVEAGLNGQSTPLVQAPVPWAIAMVRATGVPFDQVQPTLIRDLKGAGQVPTAAPNVGGWPGGLNWLTASATLARYDLAGTLAAAASPDNPLVQAAGRSDWAALADGLGRPEGFSSATRTALAALPASPSLARDRLALAMASPDLVVI